jgi:hypothetical protein
MAKPQFSERDPPRWLPKSPNRLLELMRDRRLSYDKVGARVVPAVDGSTIKKLAKGPRAGGMQMTIEWMYRLADALQCEPWDLLPDRPATILSPKEQETINSYRELAEADQHVIDRTIIGLKVEAVANSAESQASTEMPEQPNRGRSHP